MTTLPDLVVGVVWIAVALAALRTRGSLAALSAATAATWFVAETWPQSVFAHRAVLAHLLICAPAWWPRTWTGRSAVILGYAGAAFGSAWAHPAGAAALTAVLLLGLAAEHAGADAGIRRIAGVVTAVAFVVPMVASHALPGGAVVWWYDAAMVLTAVLILIDIGPASARRPLDVVVELGPAALTAPSRSDAAFADRLGASHARLVADLERGIEQLQASRRRLAEASLIAGEELRELLAAQVQAPLDVLVAATAGIPSASTAYAHLRIAKEDIDAIARGLGPRSLSSGLLAALEELAGAASVPVAVEARGPVEDIAERTARTMYLVCSESLVNADRHAEATRARVAVRRGSGYWEIEISDDGRGGADPRRGTGLTGLRDRVHAIGGTFDIRSTASGTSVRARFPEAAREPDDAITGGGRLP